MNDLISRQVAIDALARMMPRSYTPDGSHPADEEIFRAQEVFADCIEALEILPSAQPATNCSEIPNGSDDTISRQAAIDCVTYDVEHTIECLKALSSAQPDIIRCKDCKYWREHKYAKETKRYIPFCGFSAIYTEADDYCSKAERR